MWTKKQIKQHREAARLLNKIKDEAFLYIKKHPRCNEYEVQQFIVRRFKEENLKSAISDPIVAFGQSASDFHYAAPKKGSKKLRKGMPIMIDVWTRLNEPSAPFADITWMGFYGKRIPKEVQKAYDAVISARDEALKAIRIKIRNKKLPTGNEIETAAMNVLLGAGYKYRKQILHTTGHSLGTTSPHGRYRAVSFKNKRPLKKNLGYTIEPGVYFKNKFGIRSEIDFYITLDYKLKVTTKVQKDLILI